MNWIPSWSSANPLVRANWMTIILAEQWIRFSMLERIRFSHRFLRTLSVVSNWTRAVTTLTQPRSRCLGTMIIRTRPWRSHTGYSKDKRPDLKQFMVSMLCVDRNIPIVGKTQDGNSSDKTLNNELLSNISAHLAEYGFMPGASIYVADSAFVTW